MTVPSWMDTGQEDSILGVLKGSLSRWMRDRSIVPQWIQPSATLGQVLVTSADSGSSPGVKWASTPHVHVCNTTTGTFGNFANGAWNYVDFNSTLVEIDPFSSITPDISGGWNSASNGFTLGAGLWLLACNAMWNDSASALRLASRIYNVTDAFSYMDNQEDDGAVAKSPSTGYTIPVVLASAKQIALQVYWDGTVGNHNLAGDGGANNYNNFLSATYLGPAS